MGNLPGEQFAGPIKELEWLLLKNSCCISNHIYWAPVINSEMNKTSSKPFFAILSSVFDISKIHLISAKPSLQLFHNVLNISLEESTSVPSNVFNARCLFISWFCLQYFAMFVGQLFYDVWQLIVAFVFRCASISSTYLCLSVRP